MGRPDGRRIKSLDAINRLMPYIMRYRWDASNQMTWELDYEKIDSYLKERKQRLRNDPQLPPIGLMTVVIAAYVRTAALYPAINRFIVNRRFYARNDIEVSFVVLKSDWDGIGDPPETVIKVRFKGTETLDEIALRLAELIDENRKPEERNLADRIAAGLLSVPLLPGVAVGFLKFLDQHNLFPRALVNVSPFHTSMFFTNMASIRGSVLYHHLYDFGTCGIFIALGFSTTRSKSFALGITLDERMTNGSTFIRATRYMGMLLSHPEKLETPLEAVVPDIP